MFRIVVGNLQRQVCYIRCKIDKEWLVFDPFNVAHCFIKKNIRTVTFILFGYTVMIVGIVKIIIPPIICDLTNCSAAQTNHLIKPLILWSHRPGVAEMPFSKMSGFITVCLECFCDCQIIRPHQCTPQTRPPSSCLFGILAGH